MFIWWGTRTRIRRLSSGFFNCPRCRTKQPFALLQTEKVSTLYSIPLSSEVLDRFIQCSTCNDRFLTSANPEEFSSAEPGVLHESWDCPKCNKANANTRFQCGNCGYSLV